MFRKSRSWGNPRRSMTAWMIRSEEHTSELQSRLHLVCRLLLEKKKNETRPRLFRLWSAPLHYRHPIPHGNPRTQLECRRADLFSARQSNRLGAARSSARASESD